MAAVIPDRVVAELGHSTVAPSLVVTGARALAWWLDFGKKYIKTTRGFRGFLPRAKRTSGEGRRQCATTRGQLRTSVVTAAPGGAQLSSGLLQPDAEGSYCRRLRFSWAAWAPEDARQQELEARVSCFGF
jgi:hypothetical protein